MRVTVYHNILWSKYKGGVFSALSNISKDLEFVQIAETDSDRVGLSGVDMSYHTYPHVLLHAGKYGDLATFTLVKELFLHTYHSQSELVILAGYHRVEYWAQLLAAFLSDKKIAVFCDSTANDKPFSFIKAIPKWFFFHAVDGFFVYGQRSKEYIVSFGVDETRIKFGCQAAALPHDYSKDNAIKLRSELSAKVERLTYLYVGRLSYEKDLHVLLDAMKIVLQQHDNAQLRVVGSGPLQKALEDQVYQLGISHAVIFTGGLDISAIALEYAKADCFILPSNSEPWGLVVNEALSYGCPVIVSDACGCVPELVIDGVTGFVFKTGSVEDLAQCMLEVPTAFMDIENTAIQCIEHIDQFNPTNAATQILVGINTILGKK